MTSNELKNSELFWIKINQETIDDKQLDLLWKQLNVKRDKNDLLICKGRLENAPLPYESKAPYLINRHHKLAELIVADIHTKLKHISIKQTLTEVRRRFWICSGRSFIRNILRKCTLCRRFKGPSYNYPTTPPLTKLRLEDKFAFSVSGVDNFGPLYVKNIFENNSHELHKVWVTLYTCAATRAIILDLVPFMDSNSFKDSFRRFISRRGCPTHVISDPGSNFNARDSQSFINSLGVTWHTNLPLAPWYGGFFERLVKSTKELLRKELKTYKLNYEQLQTILFEVETIINNRPITYFYDDESEICLTPNHLLFGRNLLLSNPADNELSYPHSNEFIKPSKLQNIINHFWDRWRKEYLVNLREYHRINCNKKNRPSIQLNDVVIIEDERRPRSSWRLAKVENLIESNDKQIRGAVVRVSKTNKLLSRPVNKLYLVERFYKDIDVNTNKNNMENFEKKTRREAAVLGELKRKYSPQL